MSYYAVARGRRTGIFSSWEECESQISKYSGAKFKKFKTKYQAENYLKENGISNIKDSHEPQSSNANSNNNNGNINNSNTNSSKKSENLFDFYSTKLQNTVENLGESSSSNETKFNKKEELNKSDIELNAVDKSIVSCFENEDLNKDNIKNNNDSNYDDNDDYLLASVADDIEKNILYMPASSLPQKRKFSGSNRTNSKILKSGHKPIKYKSIVYEAVGFKKYGNYEFPVDSNGFVLVYTDGACENNGKPNCAAGFGVYFDDNHPLNISKPVEGRATNNCGEIQAAIYALNVAKENEIDKIIINTDSQFLINSATKWIWNWKRNKLKLKNGQLVKNYYEFKSLYPFLVDKSIQIKWNYTKAHSQIKGNEEADLLAKKGAELYKILHKV